MKRSKFSPCRTSRRAPPQFATLTIYLLVAVMAVCVAACSGSPNSDDPLTGINAGAIAASVAPPPDFQPAPGAQFCIVISVAHAGRAAMIVTSPVDPSGGQTISISGIAAGPN